MTLEVELVARTMSASMWPPRRMLVPAVVSGLLPTGVVGDAAVKQDESMRDVFDVDCD